jgi:pyridinium-3,5-bisthiocarboxylic acid mononucleotide nickel chelatase
MTSGAILMMAQIDDASGELLAEVIGRLEALGAENVQLLSSLTKKGRPGYVMMLDIDADSEGDVAALLADELGVWGYRVLHAEHKHFDIEKFETEVVVHHQGRPKRFSLRAKKIYRDRRLVRIKTEHDDLCRICAQLREADLPLPLAMLKAQVEDTLGRQSDVTQVDIVTSGDVLS